MPWGYDSFLTTRSRRWRPVGADARRAQPDTAEWRAPSLRGKTSPTTDSLPKLSAHPLTVFSGPEMQRQAPRLAARQPGPSAVPPREDPADGDRASATTGFG